MISKDESKGQDELSSSSSPSYNILVIVLGDAGRSPRMQYHTLSLLQNNFKVTLIGYNGTPLLSTLQNNKNLTTIRFNPYTPSSSHKRIIYLALRFIGLSLQLCSILLGIESDIDCILLQNPPCIPLLIISYLYSKIKNCLWIIDWHNLGYTMFYNEQQLKEKNPKLSTFLKCIYYYEKCIGNLANGHFCVSNSMKDWLLEKKCITSSKQIKVLYDQPPNFFHKIDINTMHIFMKERFQNIILKEQCPILYQQLHQEQSLNNASTSKEREITLFTEKINNKIVLRKNRPFLIISSTSWTQDEDFSILLDSLVLLDKQLSSSNQTILVIVTGKGPQKEYYKNIINNQIKFNNNIHILTPWFENNDYPIILSCADIGISLHTSTSGLDLPMKIYDMYGCSIPVFAKYYEPALKELVINGKNGYVFNNSNDLCNLFSMIINGNNNNEQENDNNDYDGTTINRLLLDKLRNGIELKNWDENWNNVALTFILDLLCRRQKKNNDNSSRSSKWTWMWIVIIMTVSIIIGYFYPTINVDAAHGTHYFHLQ